MREGEGLHRHLLREREFWAEISGHIAMRTERLEIGIVNMRIAGIDQHAARSILVQHLDMITLARGLQPQFPVGVERVNQSAGIKIIAERRITQPIRYGTEKLDQRLAGREIDEDEALQHLASERTQPALLLVDMAETALVRAVQQRALSVVRSEEHTSELQ